MPKRRRNKSQKNTASKRQRRSRESEDKTASLNNGSLLKNDKALGDLLELAFNFVIETLADLDVFQDSSTSIFLVYAHENEKLPQLEAKAKQVQMIIKWLLQLRSKTISDRSPLFRDSISVRDTGKSGAHNILENQYCLLPRSSTSIKANEVSSIDKVILCSSEVLQLYYEDTEMQKYITDMKAFYGGQKPSRTNTFLNREELETGLHEIVKKYMKSTSFHHVITEIALLKIRQEEDSCKSIVPLILNGDHPSWLPVDEVDIWLGLSDISEDWVIHETQILHKMFFKLLRRIFEDLDGCICLFEDCYDKYVTRLSPKCNSSLPSEQGFRNEVKTGMSNVLTRLIDGNLAICRQTRKTSDRSNHEDKEYMKALFVTDPRGDKIRIQETKGGLLEDSYRWILENAEFKQWRENDDDENRLLWIRGDPGKGKTMLLSGIIDELDKSADTSFLSYFFCQAGDSRINNATAVLRGLIWLLMIQQPSLISHIQGEYDFAGKTLFEGPNAWVALSKIFTNILQDPSLKNSVKSTYLVIDALDECVTDLPELLSLIIEKSSETSIKWIVSSRNWLSIENQLEVLGQKVTVRLELNSQSISTAVQKYIKYKVRQLAQSMKYNSETKSAVQDYLSLNADDTFLWVALVCQNLKTIPRWDIGEKLKTVPSGLDSLYERMLQQIFDSGGRYIRILAFVAITRRPITLKELSSLDETLEEFSDDVESLTGIIGCCGSFLTLRESTIYLVHQSAKDFLLRNEKASNIVFPSGIANVNYRIFSRSLEIMTKTLRRRDIYGLHDPGFPIGKIEQPDPDPLAKTRYSCVYWVDHLDNCDRTRNATNDLQDGGSIDMFLRKSYLYWLEALSLLGSISEGVSSITTLEEILQVSYIL
ncbi:hypothetical protein BP5796_03079 [Coleophoma crateriformis]|uniref:NACHT domain-containing protein n=1 Tax=Coleophoma crateriformis TaxID=565419 RepID=A0A3D8SM35_9HELO|nr:hypothetical protein BP5796_03079 [Coleophoma crateriformis]